MCAVAWLIEAQALDNKNPLDNELKRKAEMNGTEVIPAQKAGAVSIFAGISWELITCFRCLVGRLSVTKGRG